MKALVRFLPLLCILSCEVDDQINTLFHLQVPNGFPEVNNPIEELICITVKNQTNKQIIKII